MRRLGLAAGLFVFGWGAALAGQRQNLRGVGLDSLLVTCLVLAVLAVVTWALRQQMRNELVLLASLLTIAATAVLASGTDRPHLHKSVPAGMMVLGALVVLGGQRTTTYRRAGERRVHVRGVIDRQHVSVGADTTHVRVKVAFSILEIDLGDLALTQVMEVRIWALWSSISILPPRTETPIGSAATLTVRGSGTRPPERGDAVITIEGALIHSPVVVRTASLDGHNVPQETPPASPAGTTA